ncbi:MAG: septum formation initiator family protein [Clostridia bacterium]|nr:septum formation initiator family protein [Clostridia bacterium]
MPASTKYRESTNTYKSYDTYYNRIYTDRKQYLNTSTAYDIPTAYPERKNVRKPAAKTAKRTASSKRMDARYMKVYMIAAVFVILCFTMIYRQTVILESNQQIKALEKEYSALVAANQAMQSKIDTSLEMGEIEKFAREELGMMKPETGQVFYVDMNMEDTGSLGSVTESGMTAISGIQGTLVNAFRVLK